MGFRMEIYRKRLKIKMRANIESMMCRGMNKHVRIEQGPFVLVYDMYLKVVETSNFRD
jgi:hypothetical protein